MIPYEREGRAAAFSFVAHIEWLPNWWPNRATKPQKRGHARVASNEERKGQSVRHEMSLLRAVQKRKSGKHPDLYPRSTFDLRAGRALLRQSRFFLATVDGPGFPSDVIASERLFPIIPRTLLEGLYPVFPSP